MTIDDAAFYGFLAVLWVLPNGLLVVAPALGVMVGLAKAVVAPGRRRWWQRILALPLLGAAALVAAVGAVVLSFLPTDVNAPPSSVFIGVVTYTVFTLGIFHLVGAFLAFVAAGLGTIGLADGWRPAPEAP